MLQKTQSSISRQRVKTSHSGRLSAGERGLLQFAMIDEDDKLLHIACSQGALLRELMMRHRCEACGTTNTIENLRHSRNFIQQAPFILVIILF